ncbi:hypothetical protein EV207_1531 [Scopulibacillus darangshiensis]|uniref:Uncharacterized protein n=1 Tax=Scopulibacillus darangshiensis TaxID=442528 RepID=A0A4R2NGP6_9BACL|nr:hypothetical protein [Scopulibacillus darangshiensis]TCP20284.1 hypothetical protein EV207_1531 [Scopulibacillus darangshiensis]
MFYEEDFKNADSVTDYSLDEIWAQVERALNENPEHHDSMSTVYQYDIKGADGKESIAYQLNLINGTAKVGKS